MQPFMSQFSRSEDPGSPLRRSMGLKFTIVCALALVMTIPSFFVDALVSERSGRAAAVLNDVSKRVGGPQTFLGPVLPGAVASFTIVAAVMYFTRSIDWYGNPVAPEPVRAGDIA